MEAPNEQTYADEGELELPASYLHGNWTTDSCACALLDAVLAVCADASGSVDAEAFANAERLHNERVSDSLYRASREWSESDGEFNEATLRWTRSRDCYVFTRGATCGGEFFCREIEHQLLQPGNTPTIAHTRNCGDEGDYARAPLPPGPYVGAGWFDVVAAALTEPTESINMPACPLSAQFCLGAATLARALIRLGDARTEQRATTVTMRRGAESKKSIKPPQKRKGWAERRSALLAVALLMDRLHGTPAFYAAFVAPAACANTSALAPGIVKD